MRTMSSARATVLAMLLALSVPAVAQVAKPPAPSAPSMNFDKLIEHVTALGYREVSEVEKKSDKLYEVKARNSNGEWVELYVDSRSGEILRSKVKDKD
jgi:hypothetical protein